MTFTVKTCILLAFPLVYTKVCFNNPDGRIIGSSVYNKDFYCCDNYERKNDECVECNIGYTSSKGGQCNPCSQNTFGYRCTEICLSCEEYERCDNIYGCISLVTTTVNSSKQTESLGILPKTPTPEQSEKPYEKQDVSNFQSLNAYLIGGGGVIGIILLCTLCYKIKSYKSKNVVIIQVAETNSNAIVSSSENVYDEIDEIEMHEFIQHLNDNNSYVDEISSSSSSTDKNSASNFDDYLNPYQPILQTTEHHTYRSTSDLVAVSSIEKRDDHVHVEICNQPYVNVNQEERVNKISGYSKPQNLKYSDLEIDTCQVNSDLDEYENTRIFHTNTQIEREKQSQSKAGIEYAEIIHDE